MISECMIYEASGAIPARGVRGLQLPVRGFGGEAEGGFAAARTWVGFLPRPVRQVAAGPLPEQTSL